MRYGQDLEDFFNEKLKTGYNPFEMVATTKATRMMIEQQLKTIIEEQTRGASKSKINAYNEHFNRFMKWINTGTEFYSASDLSKMSMSEINDDLADAYRDYVNHTLDLSIKTINASITYMAKFFRCAQKKKWCNANPFEQVEKMDKKQKRTEDEKYEPLTKDEIEKIMKHLNAVGERDYLRFLNMIFHAWARPAEIARLKVKDINLESDMIRFPKGETKNQLGGYVQIVPQLKKILGEMKLEKLDGDLYLFSGDGKGFAPGKTQLNRHRPSDRWAALVKRDLKINKISTD